MFWERQSRTQRAEAQREIQEALRRHHRDHSGAQAHPKAGFLVPESSGIFAFSGAPMMGGVPVWDL